jgi:uncharacterized protein (DUF3084 family)
MFLLASAPSLSTVGIILAASAGLVGAVVALIRVRPEVNQSAVIQAQGAMETMVALNEKLKDELARANEGAEKCQAKLDDLQTRYDHAVERWGPFPNDDDRRKGESR